MKNIVILLTAGILFLEINNTIKGQTKPWSEKMANTIMTNYASGYNDGGRPWSYVVGTVLNGFEALYDKTGSAAYKTYITTTVNNEVNTDGTMKTFKVSDYNSDQIREGTALLFLYRKGNETKYKTALQTIRSQINGHPRTSDGGFWHKNVYPYQMWQDGLYMVEPFYAQYNVVLNNSSTTDFDDIAKQFILMELHARDNVSGLIYHGWDEKKTQSWANKTTGCSNCFWGRAMGWYSMALIDVLDYFPESHPKRAELILIFQRLMTALVKYQEPNSGCWYQVTDYTTAGYGAANGNYLESSCSIMYTYCLLKGVRMGYLGESYRTKGMKAYDGFLKTFVTESNNLITISKTCSSAGLSNTRNGTFAYYIGENIGSNDGKAMGPFILASLEYEAYKLTLATNILPESVNIYVTPSTATLHVDGIETFAEPFNIKIINEIGQVNISTTITEKLNTIDVSGLSKGVYVVALQSGKKRIVRKIIVN